MNCVSVGFNKSDMFADIYKYVAVLNGFVPLKKKTDKTFEIR